MWKKIQKFLCKIGLHDWELIQNYNDRDLDKILSNFKFTCKNCGEIS